MKKLYTIALAAAVALSAAAVNPAATFNAENSTLKTFSLEDVELTQPVKSMGQKNIKRSKKAAASRAVTMDDVVGVYVWDFLPFLNGMPEGMSNEVYITPTASADTVDIDLAVVGVTIKGVVDLEKATLSIPNVQKVGTYKEQDIYFFISEARLNPETGKLSYVNGTSEVEALVGTIENEGIFFYSDEYDAAGNFITPDVLYFMGVNTQPANDQLWFWLSYYDGFYRAGLVGEMEMGETTWSSAGTAVLDDAWMAPALGRDYSWVVPVEKCNELDGLYRLVHPYNTDTCPFDFGWGDGYIVFDISYPEMVPVYNYVFCGYRNTNYGYRYCATNIEGYYVCGGFEPEEVKDILPELGYEQFSTYADGTVTVKNAGMTIQGEYEEDGNPQKPFRWQKDGEEIEMEGSIKFDTVPEGGISNVTVDNNAPAVYYNLQGVRVDNPSNGLYIRRQGNTVTKVMAK